MKIKIKCILIFILLSFLSDFYVFSISAKKYKLDIVDFISNGKTNPSILRQKITPINTDRLYSSLEELEIALANIKQEIENTRLLTNITYNYELTELQENGIQLVKAIFSFYDTESFVIIPCPSVDSNSGSSLRIIMQDQNFLGLMNPLRIGAIGQLGTEKEPDNMSKLTLGGYFNYAYPFSIGATKNSWINMFNINWTLDEGKPDFAASTGLDIGIPVGNNFLKFDFIQSVFQNSDYKKYNDDFYFSETGMISMPMLIGLLNDKATVTYTPFVQVTYNWDFDGIDENNKKLRDTPKLTAGQRTSIKHVDWVGNFRNGYFISTTQSLSRNFNSNSAEKLSDMYIPYLSVNASFYKSYKNIIGIEANLNFFTMVNSVMNIGPQLRGILDKQIFKDFVIDEDNFALETESALTFNVGIPIHVFSTHWLDWFNIKNTDSGLGKLLSYIGFELHISPFLDIGLLKNRGTGEYFSIRNGLYAGGFELILYPEKWKSYAIRASLGFDLSKNKKWRSPMKDYELFIGVGHLF